MGTTALLKSPTTIRWAVILFLAGVCLSLGYSLLSGPRWSSDSVYVLALIIIALAVYLWVLDSTVWSVCMTAAAFLVLLWAWGAMSVPWLGWEIAAFAGLTVLAAAEHRRRSRRVLRIQQTLEDLDEERTIKGQGIAAATQAGEAQHKKLDRYAQLQSVAERLSSMASLTEIGQLAVDSAFALIGKSDTCLLFLIDKERQELALFASRKRDAGLNIRAKHGDQFDRHLLRTHRPLLVNDVRRDFRFTVTVAPERPVAAVIACPVLRGQSAEGVLRLDSAQAGVYTQDDLRLLDILLDLVSTAMTNARLFEQVERLAVTDGLTGLTLRRPFLEQLTRELARATRAREHTAVLMLDVDHFKAYNDTYGHMAGDMVLKGIAEAIRTGVPPGAVAARYGGEEFAVLLPRTTRAQAGEIAERLRVAVERDTRGKSRPPEDNRRSGKSAAGAEPEERRRVTISAGVAVCPDDAQVELELIRVADQRLYQAKRSGRNVVCAAG